MTATLSSPSGTRAAKHRLLLTIVALAVVLVAAAIAVWMLTSSGSSSVSRSEPASVPAQEEELTDTQKACELARVVGC